MEEKKKGQETLSDKKENKDETIKEFGQAVLDHHIHLISIIGEIEGHECLPSTSKTTKYEHLLPQLAAIEDSRDIQGVLVLLNTCLLYTSVLVIQNDIGNRHSPTVIVAAITSRMNKAKLPTHIEIDAARYHIVKDSVILLEQLRTIDKSRLRDKVCHLDEGILKKIDAALMVSLELGTYLS